MDNFVENGPLVSVIMLSYNKELFVYESLLSISSQTYKNIQCIIIDDASSDNSVRIIQDWKKTISFRCDFFSHQENLGTCRRMNEALSYVRGEYVAHLGSDDLWLPEKLEVQVREMEKLSKNIGVLYSDCRIIDESGDLLEKSFLNKHGVVNHYPSGDIFSRLIVGNFIPSMTILIRKECYDAIGKYDERLCYEDWDILLRCSQKYKFYYSSFVSAKYRITESSLSKFLSEKRRKDLVVSNLVIYNKFLFSSVFDVGIKKEVASIYFNLAKELLVLGRLNALFYFFKIFPLSFSFKLFHLFFSFVFLRKMSSLIKIFKKWISQSLQVER